MKAEDERCRLCGCTLDEASERGAYFKRVNPKGEVPCINECSPSCDRKHGNQDDALLNAVFGK